MVDNFLAEDAAEIKRMEREAREAISQGLRSRVMTPAERVRANRDTYSGQTDDADTQNRYIARTQANPSAGERARNAIAVAAQQAEAAAAAQAKTRAQQQAAGIAAAEAARQATSGTNGLRRRLEQTRNPMTLPAKGRTDPDNVVDVVTEVDSGVVLPRIPLPIKGYQDPLLEDQSLEAVVVAPGNDIDTRGYDDFTTDSYFFETPVETTPGPYFDELPVTSQVGPGVVITEENGQLVPAIEQPAIIDPVNPTPNIYMPQISVQEPNLTWEQLLVIVIQLFIDIFGFTPTS